MNHPCQLGGLNDETDKNAFSKSTFKLTSSIEYELTIDMILSAKT